jgi:hypothetical protein
MKSRIAGPEVPGSPAQEAEGPGNRGRRHGERRSLALHPLASVKGEIADRLYAKMLRGLRIGS